MGRKRAPDRVLNPQWNEKRQCWIVTSFKAGKRTRTACKDEVEAEEVKRGIEATLRRPEELTVQQAIDEWLEYQRVDRGNKPRSIKRYRYELDTLLPEATREQLLQCLTPHRAEALYRALVKVPVRGRKTDEGERTFKPRAVATHQGALQAAKFFGAWCAGKGRLLKADPFAAVEPLGGAPNRGKKKLREDEAVRFLDEAFAWIGKGRVRAASAAPALLMGMRVGEILSLRKRSVQLGGVFLYVEEEGKTGERKYRVPNEPWPMRDVFLALAAAAAEPMSYLLPFRTRQHVLDTVRDICAAACVPRVTTQGLRATHEQIAIEAGGSPDTVAGSLGHTRQVQAQHYVSPSGYAAGTQHRVLTVLRGGKDQNIEPQNRPQAPAEVDSPTGTDGP